jgi:hypothetical protein
MKTESNPTSSARQANSRSAAGANCSAEALYPSFINAAPGLARLRDEHGFCFGNVKRRDRSVYKTSMSFCATFSGFGLLLYSRSCCVSNARVAHLRSHNAKIFKSAHAPQRFLSHP